MIMSCMLDQVVATVDAPDVLNDGNVNTTDPEVLQVRSVLSSALDFLSNDATSVKKKIGELGPLRNTGMCFYA